MALYCQLKQKSRVVLGGIHVVARAKLRWFHIIHSNWFCGSAHYFQWGHIYTLTLKNFFPRDLHGTFSNSTPVGMNHSCQISESQDKRCPFLKKNILMGFNTPQPISSHWTALLCFIPLSCFRRFFKISRNLWKLGILLSIEVANPCQISDS